MWEIKLCNKVGGVAASLGRHGSGFRGWELIAWGAWVITEDDVFTLRTAQIWLKHLGPTTGLSAWAWTTREVCAGEAVTLPTGMAIPYHT